MYNTISFIDILERKACNRFELIFVVMQFNPGQLNSKSNKG